MAAVGKSGGAGGGTTTFVLGDVVGSTRLWSDQPDLMPGALGHLDTIVDAAASEHGGERPVEQGEGDSFVVAFRRALDAVQFAVEVQRGLRDGDLSVRMAIHTGDAEQRDDGRWLGPTLNRCARLRALAHGGQVLVSAATALLTVDSLPTGTTLRDLGRHRLRDLTEPEAVRQLCHPDLPADFAPLASLDRLPNNLPIQLTSFVGRDDEIAHISGLLDDHRLVTLTGAGGAGKTRLAIHVAAERFDLAPDGVWLADLSGVSDPALVPHVVASAMQVAEIPQVPAAETIARRVADRAMLVIIDNCEHMLDPVAALVEHLLRAGRNLRILATSREPLAVEGEAVSRVPSLAEPAAVQLFADRARAVRSTFALDGSNVATVAGICGRLDGLPLAIELAAARVRALAPAEIARQLSDRFSLLSAGRRGALPRQRTLEASVQWSYDFLSGSERTVLQRLTVFANGFTLAAAEQVVVGTGIDSWQVVDLLTSLVDRSLVQLEDDSGDETRYRLLETVRVFAAERLVESRDLAETRTRHLQWMVGYTTQRWGALSSPAAGRALRDLAREIDNLRTALAWAIDSGDFDAAFTMLGTTASYWYLRGVSEGLRWSEVTLELPGGDPRSRFYLHIAAGGLSLWDSDYDGVRLHGTAAAAIADALDDDDLRARALFLSGHDTCKLADGSAVDVFVQAIAALETIDDQQFLVFAHAGHGIALIARGDMKGARGAIERGLAIARAVGDPFPVASLAAVAAMAVHRTDMNALRAYVEESIASVPAEMVTNATDVALAYSSIGLSAVGDHVGALRVVEEYVSTVDSDQISLVFYEAFYLRAWLNWRAGNRWDAQLAETTARMTSVMPYISGWFAGTEADHLLDRGDTRAAMAILAGADVWALYRAMHDRISARVALAEGDVGRAVELAHSALALAWEQSDNVTAVEAVDVLAVATAVGGAAADGARIVGAGDAIRAAIGWCRGVPEQAWIDALDVDESARAETAAMSVEDAIAYVQRGRGKRGRPSFGWSSLTPTEVDVVRLVSEGLRNKEIAEKLFMSPATVKTHLTHVFAKLGVATRTELAAQAAQRTTA